MSAATGTPTMREAFTAATARLLAEDPRVALVLADIGVDGFAAAARSHPDRVINVGIREQLAVGVAGGLALEGLRPLVHSYASFLVERPFEQLKVALGHQGVGAVLVSVGASYDWAAGGRTHHAPGDVAALDALGGWEVLVPGHPAEVEPLLRHAVAGDGRVYLRLTEATSSAPATVRPGRAAVVRRGGRGTVLAVGPLLDVVLAATEGLDVTVLHTTTARPLDTASLRETLGRADVVLVEPYLAGTSAAVVSEALREVPHRLLCLGVGAGEHRVYGDRVDHDRLHGLDAAGVGRSLRAFLR